MENLQVGWDSYGGAMISRAVLLAVKQWLRAVATIDTVPPSVVPLGSGGVQVEWHDRGRDLEVAIETPGVFEVCYSSPDRTIDGEMTEDQIRDLIPVRIVQ